MKTSFQQFSRTPPEVPAELQAYLTSPSPDNRKVMRDYLAPTVKSALRSYAGDDTSLEPRAWILAMDSLKSFDASKGAALTTHVHNNLKRLNRIRMERSTAMHVPENVRTDADDIGEFVRDYQSIHGI